MLTTDCRKSTVESDFKNFLPLLSLQNADIGNSLDVSRPTEGFVEIDDWHRTREQTKCTAESKEYSHIYKNFSGEEFSDNNRDSGNLKVFHSRIGMDRSRNPSSSNRRGSNDSNSNETQETINPEGIAVKVRDDTSGLSTFLDGNWRCQYVPTMTVIRGTTYDWKNSNNNCNSNILHSKSSNSGTGEKSPEKTNRTAENLSSNLEKKSEMTTLYQLYNDDLKISKIMRKLQNENNAAIAIELCEKLQVAAMDPSNTSYIRRAFDLLAESIISVLEQGPVESLENVAKVFGVFGYVIRLDFPIYKNWIVKNYERMKDIRVYLMKSLKWTLKMDSVTLDLINYSDKLIITLKDFLEAADLSEHFIAVSDVIGIFGKNYKKSFERHFTDIVDILVGWHLEIEQSLTLKQHCSNILQQFSEYFVKKLDFTLGLLEQFLEDIIAAADDLSAFLKDGKSFTDKNQVQKYPSCALSVGSFIGAFNSVLKCLIQEGELIAYKVGRKLMENSVNAIVDIASKVLTSTSCYDIVHYINEFLIIIHSCTHQKELLYSEKVMDIIKLEINGLEEFNEIQVNSLIFLLLTYIKEMKTNIPIDLVSSLFKANQKGLLKLKLSANRKHYKSLILLYQEVLKTKNIPLLQEAYKEILMDIQYAMKTIKGNGFSDELKGDVDGKENFSYSLLQAESILSFYLTSISVLAIQTSSIIGMYALQPTILELLIKEMNASNVAIWRKSPILYDSVITLLSVHCTKNHNYILSSSLLRSNVFSKLSLEENSPTSENFSMILNFLVEILKKSSILSEKILSKILDWLRVLYEQCAQHVSLLNEFSIFIELGKEICLLTLRDSETSPLENKKIILKSAKCLDEILKVDGTILSSEILTSISEICCIHMCSVNEEIRNKYSEIFSKLPLRISLQQSLQCTGIHKTSNMRFTELQCNYIASKTPTTLKEKYFKDFIEHLSTKTPTTAIAATVDVKEPEEHQVVDNFVRQIFPKCWVAKPGIINEFYLNAMKNLKYLLFWIVWESAQYCVNNKLRTSLGKPQDTFLKIEALIKEKARMLTLVKESTIPKSSTKNFINNQKNVRILLLFIECLEKLIYNASEGTALSIPAAEKPARTFFRINISTCNEWFNRIRTAVDLIALHSMEPEMVIRYTETMLENLVKTGRTNELLFEHTLMSLVWAFLRNGESESLYGLYAWCKTILGKRIPWIKCAADQAAGYREKAADGYKNVLEPNGDGLDKHINEFIFDQLVDCQYFTSQWYNLKECLEKQELHEQRVTIPLASFSVQQIDSMIDFETKGYHSGIELIDWKCLDNLTHENISNNFSYHRILSESENALRTFMIKENKTYENSSNFLKSCSEILQFSVQESLRTECHEHLSNLIILNHILQKIGEYEGENKGIPFNLSSMVVDKKFGSVTLTRILRWTELLLHSNKRFHHLNNNFSNLVANLHLDVISLARKNNNLKFCKWELERFFKRQNVFVIGDNGNLNSLNNICKSISEQMPDGNFWTPVILRGVSELAKWKFAQNIDQQQDEAIQLMAISAVATMFKNNHTTPEESASAIKERTARVLLTLSDWLPQGTPSLMVDKSSNPLKNLFMLLPEVQARPFEGINKIIPELDLEIGKCLQASIQQCGELPKAWSAFGNWCYRWGRKVVEMRTENGEKAGLRSTEIEALKKLIPKSNDENLGEIVTILNNHQMTVDDEEIGQNETSSTELIENQLRNVDILRDVDNNVIIEIIEIWRQSHKSVYGYYELAAHAYFTYLNLATTNRITTTAITGTEDNINNSYESTGDCSIVTATLRLLRLVVKHALGLQEVIEEGLSTTPTRPWKVIIPQLFSRLNHHEPYVRKRVSELLCRIAKDSPHLIIFPAVVGAVQGSKNGSILSAATSRTSHEREENLINPLTICFNSLLDTLYKQESETVEQVQLLVHELKRVTLLWDEFWVYALAQLYSEYSELFNSLETEVRQGSGDDKLSSVLIDKHKILMEHIISDINHFYEITSREPETNYERNFQEKYSKIIENTIEELKKPLNFEKPNESWQKIKMLYALFQQRVQKNSHGTLKMIDISPILANLKNTVISMPGVETTELNPIYIKSVDNTVYILPTKTKPKKLAFFGSDGERYTYLFKGLEDLHLDERIMQFLSISNSMMSSSNDCNGKLTVYRAHHYSVIPLGSRSGLISWVDGVIPIFALYKKWQQREAANASSRKDNKQSPVLRPSELFYQKLTPLLGEQNLKTTDDRKLWPISVLRQVLDELTKETPKDLLAKELWCHSHNAAAWRRSIRNYSLSVAVMSVIGYVIGLGDRHLDNMLVKLSTGDIVHIDYNVCFEKGKTLRVPEKVPFRMTPNLETALGITGIEGTFRLTCEHVLKTLRKERETLLTLLEAFVYDPLVDWAISDDGISTNLRTTRANLAAAEMAAICCCLPPTESGNNDSKGATTSSTSSTMMSASAAGAGGTTEQQQSRQSKKSKGESEQLRNSLWSRLTDLKPEWIQYKNEIEETLKQIIHNLNELTNVREVLKKDESEQELISRQVAMIRELETLGTAMSSHPLNTISTRYTNYKKLYEEYMKFENLLKELQAEYSFKFTSYIQTIEILQNQSNLEIRNLFAEMEDACNENQQILIQQDEKNEFELVLKYCLENGNSEANQDSFFIQADQSRKELDASLMQQSTVVKCALRTLIEYIRIMKFYPKLDYENHRSNKYNKFCAELLKVPQKCTEIALKYDEYLNSEKLKEEQHFQQIFAYALEMEKFYIEANQKEQKIRELINAQFPGSNDADVVAALEKAQKDVSIFLQFQNDSIISLYNAFSGNVFELIENYLKFEENCLSVIPDVNWMLDEEASLTALITGTSEIIFSLHTESFQFNAIHSSLELLKQFGNVIVHLQELNNFGQIEITNKMISLFAENNSSLKTVVDDIIDIGRIFDSQLILSKLENHIDCQHELNMIRNHFEKCFQNFPECDYKVFFETLMEIINKIHSQMHKCIEMMKTLYQQFAMSTETEYSPLNHIKRSTLLMMRFFENYSPEWFHQHFQIKKFLLISKIFSLGRNAMQSLTSNNLDNIYHPKEIYEPISIFISEYLVNTLLGFLPLIGSVLELEVFNVNLNDSRLQQRNVCSTSSLIGSSSNDGGDNCIIGGNLSSVLYSQPVDSAAQEICHNLFAALKQMILMNHLTRSFNQQASISQHLLDIVTVHVWLNEKTLMNDPTTIPLRNMIPMSRTNLLQNMMTLVQNLKAWEISINKIKDELLVFTSGVLQKMNFPSAETATSSGGFSMNLQVLFDESIRRRDENLQKHAKVAATVLNYCSIISNYEMLAANPVDIIQNDERVSVILNEFAKTFVTYQKAKNDITKVEVAIIELLHPEGQINHIWIKNISELLDDMTENVQEKLADREKELNMIQDNIQVNGNKLHHLLDNEIRMNIRYLMKTLLKSDTKNRQFQNSFKQFFGRLNLVNGQILSATNGNELKENAANQKDLQKHIKDVLKELDTISNDFVRFIMEKHDSQMGNKNSLTPSKDSGRKGNQPEQKRNAYAVSVWRRIRMKLEGRDPDQNRRLTVPEQVDWMIREAMNPDNLATLYEGWTPWI